MAVATIPRNLPVPDMETPFDPFSLLTGPLTGGFGIPGFTGGSASSDTGPQSGTNVVNIPVNSPFQVGQGNASEGLQSSPTASASAPNSERMGSDLVMIAAIVAAALVLMQWGRK